MLSQLPARAVVAVPAVAEEPEAELVAEVAAEGAAVETVRNRWHRHFPHSSKTPEGAADDPVFPEAAIPVLDKADLHLHLEPTLLPYQPDLEQLSTPFGSLRARGSVSGGKGNFK